MKAREELAQVTAPDSVALTIGVFDGVHLGHQHLLHHLKMVAHEHGCGTAVITFRNHPRVVLGQDTSIPHLMTLEERVRLLQAAGMDLVLPLTFDVELSRLRAQEFIALLQERLHLRCLVVGPDFALGYRREGDIPALQLLGEKLGFTTHVIQPLVSQGRVVSSTAIRQAVTGGDMELATDFLGRPFTLEGTVNHGAGRGERLGFPTANLEVGPALAIPRNGIYATWAWVNSTKRPSATNVGTRPTFGESERTIETHVLDFRGDLYQQRLRLEFVRRLRDEVRFDSPDALIEQMRQDVEETRALLSTTPGRSLRYSKPR